MFPRFVRQLFGIVSSSHRHSLFRGKAVNDEATSGSMEARRYNAIIIDAARLRESHDKHNILDCV